MSVRNYNRLHVNRNREDGSEKLMLGYSFDRKEIILRKDTETHFHIPYFTKSFDLANDKTLILNGAIGGPFPAASDRIYKNKKNFGHVTPYGNPDSDAADGTWFCSWLYKNEKGQLGWLDRFYNPNSNSSLNAASLNYGSPNLNDEKKAFIDIPTRMRFDPGVLYKYFHVGEKTINELVASLDGTTGEHLLLDLSNWESDQINSISSEIQPTIFSKSDKSVFAKSLATPGKKNLNVFNFEIGAETGATIDFNSSYTPTTEFTLSFWANCSQWASAPSTQLLGNYSSKGGYGLFLQNLDSFPFFVISETNYGHILFTNTFGNSFFDKVIQVVPGISDIPIFTAFDMNHNLFVCNKDDTGTVYKFDNMGTLVASTKTADDRMIFSDYTETPLHLFCGPNNSVYVLTHKMMYTLDEQLNRINQIPIMFGENDIASFKYDAATDTSELIITNDVYDSKFIGSTQWFLSRNDGNLYRKSETGATEIFYEFEDTATNLAIDPFERLWVLHGTNKLTILDSTASAMASNSVILNTNVGLDTTKNNKNISFFTDYKPSSNTYEWQAIIYYSSQDDRSVYFLNLDGQSVKTININSLFDQRQIQSLKQESKNFKFLGKGDFTGYEHKRIFKQLSPYKNSNQLVLKTSLKDGSHQDLLYKTFTKTLPISSWSTKSWQHFALTLSNNTFNVYINSELAMTLPFSGRYKLSYEMQPLFFIGTSAGSQIGLNQEIQHVSDAFVGQIADIKIHDYALELKDLELMIRSLYIGEHMSWMLPVPKLEYIEKIERVFKHKIPGSKSFLYKIKIRGSEIEDQNTRDLIEERIRIIANEMQPGHSDFLQVEWIV